MPKEKHFWSAKLEVQVCTEQKVVHRKVVFRSVWLVFPAGCVAAVETFALVEIHFTEDFFSQMQPHPSVWLPELRLWFKRRQENKLNPELLLNLFKFEL